MTFHRLFRGRSDAYGQYVIKDRSKGKVEGSAWTEKKKVTKKLYEDHLAGKSGLGIIPLTEEGTCYWGAIDVDDYSLDLKQLEVKIRDTPLVLCRTKSGGAHLFLFAKNKPFPAALLIEKLQSFAMSLGFASSEIFPKQIEGLGNWLNLPYFDSDRTTRYCLHEGRALKLEEFLKLSKEKSISDIEKVEIKLPTSFNDAPPCLQYLVNIGVQSGQKDLSLFNFAVYCKLKYEDSWEDELHDINQSYVHPPAKTATMKKVIKPHRKKDYFYTCTKDPIKSYCNKDECLTRAFGVGHGNEPPIEMGQLTKITTIPPVWYLEVEGQSLEFQTSELMDQGRFRRVCCEKINKIPPLINKKRWDKILQDKLDTVNIVEAPEDAGPVGQFYYLLKMFCTERAIARTKDELLQNKPWINNGYVYFQSPALMSFLDAHKFRGFKPHIIYSWIRTINGSPARMKIKGKSIRVWAVPAYEDQQDEDFDVPEMDEAEF